MKTSLWNHMQLYGTLSPSLAKSENVTPIHISDYQLLCFTITPLAPTPPSPVPPNFRYQCPSPTPQNLHSVSPSYTASRTFSSLTDPNAAFSLMLGLVTNTFLTYFPYP